jgi:hypothetical protein
LVVEMQKFMGRSLVRSALTSFDRKCTALVVFTALTSVACGADVETSGTNEAVGSEGQAIQGGGRSR